MTMRGYIFLLILALSGLVFLLTPAPASAQGQNIAEVLQEKEKQGSGMKSRSFRKPKPAEMPAATESGAEDVSKTAPDKGYSEIVEDTDTESKDEQRPPEEDVWEKYKSIAAGSESKPLARKSYTVTKEEETTHTKKIRKPSSEDGSEEENEKDSDDTDSEDSEDSDDSEDKEDDKEAEAPKKKKGGMAGILEDYKNKQTKKNPIRGHVLNQ